MRDAGGIDIRKYMPWYYEGLPELDALSDSQNAEYRYVTEDDEALSEDAYIVSAQEDATTRREREIFIRADRSNEAMDFRRKRIINRYTIKPPFTIRWLEQQLEALLGQDVFTIGRENGVNTLFITMDMREFQVFKEFLYTLEVTVPLNMGMRYVVKSQTDYSLYMAPFHLRRFNYVHDGACRGKTANTKLYFGIGLFERRTYTHEPETDLIGAVDMMRNGIYMVADDYHDFLSFAPSRVDGSIE